MSVVYIREQGAMVRKSGQQLRVMQGEKHLLQIPLANLEQLIIVGNVQLTTPAAILLLKSNIDVVFMSTFGTYQGRLARNESRFAELRHQQLRVCDDSGRALRIAMQVVSGKIANQRVVLQRRAEENREARRALNGMMDMLHKAERAGDLDQLRGYEGKAAASYFAGVRTFFSADWGFQSRQYYPPPDPANALLSFAYTLLLKDTVAGIQLVGLDPYLGFFHALGYNRPALALDIMEEFRPTVADIVVLTLVVNRQITLDDFEWTDQPELPVRMNPSAVEKLIAAYETRMEETVYHPLANGQTSYRRALELQARRIARVIQGTEANYEALVMR
jgi:CRISPR-associated protein Cas1